jgi:hypothetical protein
MADENGRRAGKREVIFILFTSAAVILYSSSFREYVCAVVAAFYAFLAKELLATRAS